MGAAVMKGRVVVTGKWNARDAAALVVDGVVDDLIVDPKLPHSPKPGTIIRAKADRPMKGQGGIMVSLPEGPGYLRSAREIKPGQFLLVQVISVAEPGKAPPVTNRILFKGRSVIITPHAPGLNISRGIRDEAARLRLHDIVSQAMGSEGWGVIVRSAATELDDAEIDNEIHELRELTQAVVGDQSQEIETLVDGQGAHELAWREWSAPRPDAIEDGPAAMEAFGIDTAIEAALLPELALDGGASMVVEPTRALTAVDVNTGADNSPAASLKANIAAARALPRALRLRGLGGQVTIDFAPMAKRDRRQIEQVLRSAFKADPIETALVGWTPLGHFELQRKRERFAI